MAEAIEFLLTGRIARRELLAGAKDEFADSLRNAHVDDKVTVAVEALILGADGKAYKIKRELVCDYKRGSAADCESKLTIDGVDAAEDELQSTVGLVFFPSPLDAPVLSQHSLGYLFSSAPKERAAYFRAVLDTQDLENFRAAVESYSEQLVPPITPDITVFNSLLAVSSFENFGAAVQKCKKLDSIEKTIGDEVIRVLKENSIKPQATLCENIQSLKDELSKRRESIFPLNQFHRDQFVIGEDPAQRTINALKTLRAEQKKCDLQAIQFIELFEAALKLPELHEHPEGQDCPLCGTEQGLSEDRIEWIKNQARSTQSFQNSLQLFAAEISRTNTIFETTKVGSKRALPQLVGENNFLDQASEVSPQSIAKLGVQGVLISDWLRDLRFAYQCYTNLSRSIDEALDTTSRIENDPLVQADDAILEAAFSDVNLKKTELAEAVKSYQGPERRLLTAINTAIDESTSTDGWEHLITLATDPEGALVSVTALNEFYSKKVAVKKAIGQINKGIGAVQDLKFSDLSDEVRKWWDLLRPDEPTFFEGVQRRGANTKRMVDLRAGLSAEDDQSNPKFRDAVAVFSQSQLHCLGLSIFLARASSEKVGFVVLDDPVLTSDDDFSPNFASSVIEQLLAEGIQVLILTQDQKTAKDIVSRWSHLDCSRFDIIRNDAKAGTEIRNEDDDLAIMIARAQPLCSSADPTQRQLGATRVRQAIERFGKLVLVKEEHKSGNSDASLTDYEGKNFGDYSAKVYALLVLDPSHLGKIRSGYSYCTPGPHDDGAPSKTQLKVALGDLRKLKTIYLD